MITRSKLWSLLIISVILVATQGCGPDSLLKENTGTMENLGVLPGAPHPFSSANGVDSGGIYVVGYSDSRDGMRAFDWHREAGMRNLGVPEGWTTSKANAVSGNGQVIVGTISRTWHRTKACKIIAPGVMETLEILPLETNESQIPYSTANSVNDDGTFIVGASGTKTSEGIIQTQHAVRWTGSLGPPEDLGVLPGGTQSEAKGVNGNGHVVVGWSDSSDGKRAFLMGFFC